MVTVKMEMPSFSPSYYAKRIRQVRELLSFYKETLGCARCGEKNPILLQFHHIAPIAPNRAGSLRGNRNFDGVFAEVRKCVILCANCHLLQPGKNNAGLAIFK